MGRPVATSHAAIEQAAFALFAEHGFRSTTMEAIAEVLGISRRTVFRYYPSKNDIPWGQFDQTLQHLRELLVAQPAGLPVHQVVHRAVVEFNRFPAEAQPSHRERMRLILGTPELQAHSVLRYAAWRQVITEHVARRTGVGPEDPGPLVAGQVALALSLAAYERWLERPDDDPGALPTLIDQAMAALRGYLTLTRP